MNFILKLINHIWHGTLVSRFINHRQIEDEKRWRKFFTNSNKEYIIKKFKRGGKIRLYKDNLISKGIFNNLYERHEINYLKKVIKK